MFSGVSALTNTVDSVFLIFLVTTLALFCLIVSLTVVFVVRYSRKRHPQAEQIEGSTKLEIIWTVIPLFIVLALFYFGWQGARWSNQLPDEGMQVKVIASMWQWNFEYPNGKMTTELKVPVDQVAKLHLIATDVLHSFYVPAFRMKEDTVPGMDKYTWFEPKEIGSYDIFCAEYCGLNHAYMLSKVEVLSQADFDAWYNAEVEEGPAAETDPDSTAPPADSEEAETATSMLPGEHLVRDMGCILCHTTTGDASVAHESAQSALPTVGPSFKGIYGKKVELSSGNGELEILVDEDYLRRSIMEPSSQIVKGYQPVMPARPMTEQELTEIVNYLKEL